MLHRHFEAKKAEKLPGQKSLPEKKEPEKAEEKEPVQNKRRRRKADAE